MKLYTTILQRIIQSHTQLSDGDCSWLCHFLRGLIEEGESEYVEFKEDIPVECRLAYEMVAMDIEGGVIVLGISDKGVIVGLPGKHAKREVVDNQVANCIEEPAKLNYDVLACTCNGKKLLFVFVYPSSHEYIRARDGKCYVRVGATKQPVPCEKIVKYKLEK